MVTFSFFFSEKTSFLFRDLEELNSQDLFSLLEEIPSGNNSEVDDCSDDELLQGNDVEIENDLIDINSLDIVYADDLLEIENCVVHHSNNSMNVAADQDLCSSEDEIDLNTVKQKILRNNTIWTTENSYCPQNKKEFNESYGLFKNFFQNFIRSRFLY